VGAGLCAESRQPGPRFVDDPCSRWRTSTEAWDCARVPANRLTFGVDALEEAAENTGFAFFQANVVLNFALADDGLLNTADGKRFRLPTNFY